MTGVYLIFTNDATTESYTIDLTPLVDEAIKQGVKCGCEETLKNLGRRLIQD